MRNSRLHCEFFTSTMVLGLAHRNVGQLMRERISSNPYTDEIELLMRGDQK